MRAAWNSHEERRRRRFEVKRPLVDCKTGVALNTNVEGWMVVRVGARRCETEWGIPVECSEDVASCAV